MAMNVHTLGENILYDIGIEVKKGRSTRGSLLRLDLLVWTNLERFVLKL